MTSSGNEKTDVKPILDFAVVDPQIHPVLEKRFEAVLKDVENEVKTHGFLKWIVGSVLLILLGLNGFIVYQQWQQSQQIDGLVKQSQQINELIRQPQKTSSLVKKTPPASQTSPGAKHFDSKV
ncbi:MAG: hypothetical protein WCA35_10770, partial [Kovacikia sp.]